MEIVYICCSICNVWHHLNCTDLSREEFLQHTRNKNLYWECPKCVVYRCGKCSTVLGKCGCILCNHFNKWFHKRCSLLDLMINFSNQVNVKNLDSVQNARQTAFSCFGWKKNFKNCLIYLLKNWKKQLRGSHGVTFATKRTFTYQLQ